jgi:hypothetical protein
MSLQAVLLPLFVQVALSLFLMTWFGALRVRDVRSGQVHPRDVALREPNWPKLTTQVGNCAQNQLEFPTLFYVLTILAWMTKQADLLFVILAWVFVILRLIHAYIHVTDNDMARRGMVFIVGAAVLIVMWIIFMLRILIAI